MKQKRISTRNMAIFSMLGGLMYMSKIMMEWLPNIHLLGVLIVVYTIVYGKDALVIIYIYVFLIGTTNGFSPWWYTNLYTWALLWAMAMCVPRNWNTKIKIPTYMLVCGLHGLTYGLQCAPLQAIMFGLSWEGMIGWVIAGIPFDLTHGISNFTSGIIIVPLAKCLQKLEQSY